MIAGIFLRLYKTYEKITYIPISNGESLCGLLGQNGVGKTTILEALDTLFNDKEWNLNIHARTSHEIAVNSSITPIFIIKSSQIPADLKGKCSAINAAIRPLIKEHDRTDDCLSRALEHLSQFDVDKDYYILPIGISLEREIHFGAFHELVFKAIQREENDNNDQRSFEQRSHDLGKERGILGHAKILPYSEEEENIADDEELHLATVDILNFIKNFYHYIYIPKDINLIDITHIERQEIQALMGQSLFEIIEDSIPKSQIETINNSLEEFVSNLSTNLVDYTFIKANNEKTSLNKQALYELVIKSFFNPRRLHKKRDEQWLSIESLSSGEKQQALIEVIHYLISLPKANTTKFILAIDEPESSLHISGCYDQFMKLSDLSLKCSQLIFSSHWYGFFPVINEGIVTCISKKDRTHQFDIVSLGNFRETLKQREKSSKGILPYDIRLKSNSDLVQTIMTSLIDTNGFNWIICEGSSEKKYLSFYYKEYLTQNHLRIIPVGGAKEVKRIYFQLKAAMEIVSGKFENKIFLLTDTDAELLEFETEDHPHLRCRRLVNTKGGVALCKVNSNPKSPETEIEDSLNGKAFHKALCDVSKGVESVSFLHSKSDISEKDTYLALDLTPSERIALNDFLDSSDNKMNVACRYIEILGEATYSTPNWIKEIETFLFPA